MAKSVSTFHCRDGTEVRLELHLHASRLRVEFLKITTNCVTELKKIHLVVRPSLNAPYMLHETFSFIQISTTLTFLHCFLSKNVTCTKSNTCSWLVSHSMELLRHCRRPTLLFLRLTWVHSTEGVATHAGNTNARYTTVLGLNECFAKKPSTAEWLARHPEQSEHARPHLPGSSP